MGCLCSCLKQQDDSDGNVDEANEFTPLTTGNNFYYFPIIIIIIISGGRYEGYGREGRGDKKRGDHDNGSQRGPSYYKSIVDDAQGKFISSVRHHRARGVGSNTEEIRSRLSNATVDQTSLNRLEKQIDKGTGIDNKGVRKEEVLDILSEPIITSFSDDIDRVSDEVADIVSNFVNIRIDDSNSMVVSFKVV